MRTGVGGQRKGEIVWLKIHKTFRGGRSKPHYIELDPSEESDYDSKEEYHKELATDWAEGADGGHNYGWRVYWEEIDKPPQEWLVKHIKGLKDTLEYYKTDAIKNLQEEIKRKEKEA